MAEKFIRLLHGVKNPNYDGRCRYGDSAIPGLQAGAELVIDVWKDKHGITHHSALRWDKARIYDREFFEAILATAHEEIEPTAALVAVKHDLTPEMLGRMVIDRGLLSAAALDEHAAAWMNEENCDD